MLALASLVGVLVERLQYVVLKLVLVEVWGRGNEGEERQKETRILCVQVKSRPIRDGLGAASRGLSHIFLGA